MQFIIAFHHFFPFFFASSMRNATRSHADSLLILQSWAVSSRRPRRSEEGEQELTAQL